MAASSPLPAVVLTNVLLSIAAAALLFILAASDLAIADRRYFVLLLVSAILEILQCLPSGLVILRFWRRSHGTPKAGAPMDQERRSIIKLFILVLPWFAVAAMGAIALGTLAADRASNFFGRGITITTLVVWITATSVQALLFFVLNLSQRGGRGPEARFATDEPMDSIHQQESRLETPVTIRSNPFKDKLPSPLNLSPPDGNSSHRSSLSTIRRPESSKKDVSRSSSQPRQSERTSSDGPPSRPSQDNGFDAWDTSALSTQMRETVLQLKSLNNGKSAALPTIPGSRSPSPAKALEGPFLDESPEHTPPRSPLPQPPVSQSAPNLASRFPPAGRTPLTTPPSSPPQTQPGRTSKPPSLTRKQSGEENIHPLFRCSSPTPPPSASPTTNVTAAPEAGEVIDRRTLNRMRSASQRSSSQPPTSHSVQRSESLVNTPNGNESSPMSDVQPKSMHQRKRSASFEGCIIRPEV